MHEAGAAQAEETRASRWLSHGLERLIRALPERRTQDQGGFDFDLVIVGSGYGGAVALERLAGWRMGGRPLRIALLERGREYLAGAFPGRFADLAGHVRFTLEGSDAPQGVRTGLFDIRLGPDVHALLGNGLGGGSLINAGVMALPHASVWSDARWPAPIRAEAEAMAARGRALQAELGATPVPEGAARSTAMERLAHTLPCEKPPVSVAKSQGPNAQGVTMRACIGCGDCLTGCNHGAKASLDLTLLAAAAQRPGVEIVTGAAVDRLRALEGGGFELDVFHTDAHLRQRQGGPLRLRAARVVLAAGSFGSTEILMRSAKAGLSLSKSMLGAGFSANGDAIAAVADTRQAVNGAAREDVEPGERAVGPTITRSIDLRSGDPARDFVLQDLGVPAALCRAYEEIVATSLSLGRLGESDRNRYGGSNAWQDACALDPARRDRTLLLAVIGPDDAGGRLQLDTDPAPSPQGPGEGVLTVSWPELRADPRFAARLDRLQALARRGGLGGRVLANPLWRPLGTDLEAMFGDARGPQLTVHPLGGCRMGEDAGQGVVDHLGRVFRGQGAAVYDDLVVLDGSIVPCALGINPALSIACLAARAAEGLRSEVWRLEPPTAPPAQERRVRPRFDAAPGALRAKPTMVEVSELLKGSATLDLGEGRRDYAIELELRSQPVELRALMRHDGPREVPFDPARSRLRLYHPEDAAELGRRDPRTPWRVARVEGRFGLFAHAPSTPWQRRRRALHAWWINRGRRDLVQSLRRVPRRLQHAIQSLLARFDLAARPNAMEPGGSWRLLPLLWAQASRAGDERRLDYVLRLAPMQAGDDEHPRDPTSLPATELRGHKTFTYALAANPWQQLMQVRMESLPGLAPGSSVELCVDPTYFNRNTGPLLKLVGMQDMPTALADLGAFAAYLGRLLLDVHLLSFRKPDALDPPWQPAKPGMPDRRRLPGALPDLGEPQRIRLYVRPPADDPAAPCRARLSRYRPLGVAKDPTPVLLIHGYSASGTTFAHPALPEGGLAAHLARHGRDAWVLDLRSSCGLPGATHPFTFEQIGYADIPLAIERVLERTGAAQVDVVAHCMGAAMLGLALLGDYPTRQGEDEPHDVYVAQRVELPQRIRRLVLSQVGPSLVLAPANVLRAYVMHYLQHYLPLAQYRFRPEGKPGALDELLDRLFATIPYPKGEFELENPYTPAGAVLPWVSVRHRMDALYGVTFKLADMDPAVLDRIDDFFGPLNVQTITQVIRFVGGRRATDARGRGYYTAEERMRERLPGRVLSLHADQNGLIDPVTEEAMRNYLTGHAQARAERLGGFGHQDSLVGRRAPEVYLRIRRFLEES